MADYGFVIRIGSVARQVGQTLNYPPLDVLVVDG